MKTTVGVALAVLAVVASAGAAPAAAGILRFGPAAAGAQVQAVATVAAGRPVVLTAKARERADFTSSAEWCWSKTSVLEDGQTYTRLDLPGLAATGEVGEPRVPFQGQFIRVPDGADVQLVLDDVAWVEIEGRFALEPVQPPLPAAATAERPAFAKSPAAYARDAWQPAAPVRIADRMRIRGREFVYVAYAPVACNPARGALRAATRVAWHLVYTLPEGGSPAPRPDPQGEAAFAQVFERALDGTVPEAYAVNATPAAHGTVPGADYMMIVPEEFVNEALPLAQLKDRMGLTVRLVPLMSISTNGLLPGAFAITAFIRNAYQTWVPRPTYVVLVGDTDRIPPHNEAAWWPARPGMPATDLYYAAVDGIDIFPDLLCGRLSCASAAECKVIVDKIVNHQVSPNAAPGFRNGAFIPGMFQDCWHSKEKGFYSADGIEGMRFIETAEALKDFLEVKGMTVRTSYTSDTNVVPRRYDPNSYYHDGASIYIGTQEFLSNAVAQARTRQIMGEGVGLVSYHAHGGVGGWDNFNVSDVSALNNGTRLPFVISLTCLTGAFDDPGGPCFAEALLRRSGGGAVAVVACSRVSYQDGNDWSRIGLQEALWPDYLETVADIPGYDLHFRVGGAYSGYGPRLGQAVNFGKMYYYEKNGSQDGARYHFEVMTLFGDPHMHFQPWNDNRLNVTYPASVSARQAEFDVAVVSDLGTVVTGATVAVSSAAGDSRTYTTDGSGHVHVSFAPLALDSLTVTVVRDGYIPHIGTISLVTDPLTVSHPATASALAAGFTVNVQDAGAAPVAGAVVLASSSAGDHVERTTDAAGNAVFAIAPLSISTLNITVAKRAYTTYRGFIRLLPGTLRVTHAARVDELNAPVSVEVRDQGGASVSATVTLTSAGGVHATQAPGPDCIARFAVQPLANDPLHVTVTARGYTPYEADIPVVAGRFVWDALPATLDVGGLEPVAIRLESGIDGSTVITGYTGSATLDAVSFSDLPPEVVITDVRRAGATAYVVVECVKTSWYGHVHMRGWQLVTSDSVTDINSVWPDVKDPDVDLSPFVETAFYGLQFLGDSRRYWQPPMLWTAARPGWVMLLDAQTNVVDLVVWGWDAAAIATMAPVIGGRVIDVQAYWNGDGVPADPDNPHIARIRSANPQDRNMAADFTTRPLSGSCAPYFTTPFAGAGQYLEMTPTETGAFSNGVWRGRAAVWELMTNVVFRAEDGPHAGDSEAFELRQPDHVNFGFAAFNTQQLWNATFTVTVRALDKYTNTYANFQGQTRLYGFVDAPAAPVLITECGVSSSSGNYIEIQNVSGSSANTAGWQLLLGDSRTDIDAVNRGGVTLRSHAPAGDAQIFDESPKSLAYWGAPIDWSLGAPGWVMLLDGASNVVDFVAWGWSEAAITNLAAVVQRRTVRVGSQWVGAGVGTGMRGLFGPLERRGSVDYNRSADFKWGMSGSRGRRNTGLQLPLLAARRPVPVVPNGSGVFASGVWTGSVFVQEDVDSMYLEAVDQAGRFGDSARFNVRYLGPITVTVPRLVREGDGEVTGTVSVPAGAPLGLVVRLRSTDTSEVNVDATVTILDRISSGGFTIAVVNDKIVDFTQDVRIEASARGCGDGYGRIGVQDDETATIALTVPAATTEGAGTLVNAGDIGLSANVGQDTIFRLTSTDTTELQVPASVTLPSGQRRARFDITVVNDSVADGAQTARITVTPDDLLFKTGAVVVADNDAHHFAFRPIGNVQTACVPFQVTVQAVDASGLTVNAYTGQVDLTAEAGASTLVLKPRRTGSFVRGEWAGALSVMEPGSRAQLVAFDGLPRGTSDRFDVTHGPLTHFAWTQCPTGSMHAGAWLPVRLEARDAHDFPVTAYRGPARIEVTQHDPAYPLRLLTFVRHAQMERGYRLAREAIARHFPHVVETLTTTTNEVDLVTELGRHDVFLLVAQEDAPPGRLAELGRSWARALTDFTDAGGVVIACSRFGDEHVLLREAGLANLLREGVGSKLSPFVMLDTVASNRLTAGVAVRFEGQDVAGYSGLACEPLVRSASNGVWVVMQRAVGAGQVVMIGNGFAEPNADFDRILANAVRLGLHRVPRMAPFAPEATGAFTDGVWTGIVQVSSAGLDTQVDADDQEGHRGGFGLFDVAPLSLRGFRYDPVSRGLVFEWDSAGVTRYAIEYAEGGPDREFHSLDNIPATPPLNTYTGKLGSAAARFYHLRAPAR